MNTATEHDLDLPLARLKAIADEKRLRILSLLAGGERCVCELQDELDAGQSLLSHHLKALRDAGLVTDRRSGRWVHYTLNREALHEIELSHLSYVLAPFDSAAIGERIELDLRSVP